VDTQRVVFEGDTELGHYQIVDTIYTGRPARVLYSGHRQAAQSGVALDDKDELLFDYNERFMELIRGLSPRRILLIGGGAFTLPRAINQEFPSMHLDVVELDKQLYDLATQYFSFQPTKFTRLYFEDGFDYLQRAQERYDLIILDVFLHATIPTIFQDSQFTETLPAHLRKGGVVAMNIIAGYYGERGAGLRRQIEAFQVAFSDIQLYPAGREPSLWLPQNFILTAQNDSRDLQPLLRFARLKLP